MNKIKSNVVKVILKSIIISSCACFYNFLFENLNNREIFQKWAVHFIGLIIVTAVIFLIWDKNNEDSNSNTSN